MPKQAKQAKRAGGGRKASSSTAAPSAPPVQQNALGAAFARHARPRIVGPSQRAKQAQELRLKLRDEIFGTEVEALTWHKREKGFCSIPRSLPLIATLIKRLTRRADAGRIYIDLWSRQHEDGFVDIRDEEEMAASVGYVGGHRGVRAWRQGMAELTRLGFIRVKPKRARKHGYALLMHPHDVVQNLRANSRTDVPDWWWDLFRRRIIEVGTNLRADAIAATN